MLIVLDNAESVLDPQGANSREIYGVVEELSRFKTICLCITSRISTVPPDCEALSIPTLSMQSACDAFYRIYKNGERSDVVGRILEQLEFHPLSITLLATTASHNKWNYNRLVQEWDAGRTQMLRTDYNESLAATIELSLASPMFRELGPNARGLLGVVAFFPQGIDENNLDWFFPFISNRRTIFDKFCVLSLTHQSDGFITMLAPLRDYLCPEDPTSSPLLHATKECYLRHLSIFFHPGDPGHDKTRWILLEDVNVEHLLDVFTSVDVNSDDIWGACGSFMKHLYWHKPRLVVLGPKLEGLLDDHPSKPVCLFHLSRLFDSVGHHAEYKRLLIYTLKLWRERGNDVQVAVTLMDLSDANRKLSLYKEGILQAKESLGIFERLNDVSGQARSLQYLARLLRDDEQPDAAEETVSRSIDLLPDGDQFELCQCHRLLGDIYRSKGETNKAIDHFNMALRAASSFDSLDEMFWIHFALVGLLCDYRMFDGAHTQVECAKLCAVNKPYYLGCAVRLHAQIWHKQRMFEEAKSEALRAVGVFEKLGATRDLEVCKELLWDIEERMRMPVTSDEPGFDGELWRHSHFLHLLTLHPQLGKPIDGADNCLDFSRCILPRTINPTEAVSIPSSVTFLVVFSLLRSPSFQAHDSSHQPSSYTRAPFYMYCPTIHPSIRLQCCAFLPPMLCLFRFRASRGLFVTFDSFIVADKRFDLDGLHYA
jgi:tetratricopeptide (TPR) repeat protein